MLLRWRDLAACVFARALAVFALVLFGAAAGQNTL